MWFIALRRLLASGGQQNQKGANTAGWRCMRLCVDACTLASGLTQALCISRLHAWSRGGDPHAQVQCRLRRPAPKTQSALSACCWRQCCQYYPTCVSVRGRALICDPTQAYSSSNVNRSACIAGRHGLTSPLSLVAAHFFAFPHCRGGCVALPAPASPGGCSPAPPPQHVLQLH